MKLMIPDRIAFKGPDPPPSDWDVEDERLLIPEPVPAGKAAAKKKEEIPPPEVPKSPEVEQSEKMVRRFMKQFMTNLLTLQSDLNEYRGFASDVKKRALWPKVLTTAEI